jgi:RNA polymerase sigma-70 factor (ECF subfamily)
VQSERDFTAWLDHRDADALARVFDATGGKLLLLAAHLAGSGERAQDLVQATFLAAIARGASWDRARPLWPWLAAILHNELLMERRRGRRRREVDLDAAHAAASDAPGPQQLAASEEALAAVLRAIDALPLPYRQVLRLRLVHGLRPVDIARSLEVPVGTVRAQLHRGLEQLRGALPAGVAGALAVLLVGDDVLLAQVRMRVLEHAATGSPAAAAVAAWSLLGGWLSMNGKTIGIVSAAGVLLACLSFAFGVPSWFAEPPRPPTSASPARAELPVADPSAPSSASEPRRELAAGAVAAMWPLEVTVQTYDGALIPGAQVTVWTTLPGGVFWYCDASDMPREEIIAGATGSDGVFRASLDALRERPLLLRRTTQLWIEASWPHDEPHQIVVALPRTSDPQPVTATIELRRRLVITGRAVDGAGNAIAAAHVFTSRSFFILGSEPETRADGTFFVGCGTDAEEWPEKVVVASPAHGIATVAVPAWSAEQRGVDLGTIVLQATDVVQGRVVLGDGSALGGMQVCVQAIDPSLGNDLRAIHQWLTRDSQKTEAIAMHGGRAAWTGAQTSTRADGSFRFTGLRPDGVYLLTMWAIGAPADTVVRPGGDAIELRVDKQVLTIDVVGDRGEPIPGAQVRLAGYDPTSTRPSWEKRPGFPETGQVCGNWMPMADPDGKPFVLSPFGFVWCVMIADDFVQPVAVRHEALPGVYRATCRVEVRVETRFGKLHICAVDENGAPINFGPIMKSLDRELQVNDRRVIMPPEGRTWDLPAGRWHVETVLGKEVTYLQDEGGYARGFQDHDVTVEDGRTTELKLVAAPAGLVAFDVHANDAPIPSWRTLRVEAAGREFAVLPRDPSHPVPTRAGAQITEFIGKQALPPGKHTFLVQADGYQPATCEVDVVADQLATVRVELQPK